MTDMDTAAGEGLRRRRTGGRARPRAPPAAPAAAVGAAADALRADGGHLRRRARVDPRRVAARPVRDRDGLPRSRCARGAQGGGRTHRPRHAARAVRPGHGHRDDQDGTLVVHAPRPEPGARRPARWRLDGVRDGRQPAQRRGPRPRPAHRQSRGLPEPAATRAAAQPDPLPVGLPGRAGRRAPRRASPARDARRPDAHGQGDPLLQPGSPAQHRLPRDGPHRAGRGRRHARSGAIDLHGRELELAAPARRADAAGDHGVRAARADRVHHAVHAGRRHGAGDPRGRPLGAERRGAGGHGPDPGRFGRGRRSSTAASPRTSTCSRARRRSGRRSTCGPR